MFAMEGHQLALAPACIVTGLSNRADLSCVCCPASVPDVAADWIPAGVFHVKFIWHCCETLGNSLHSTRGAGCHIAFNRLLFELF